MISVIFGLALGVLLAALFVPSEKSKLRPPASRQAASPDPDSGWWPAEQRSLLTRVLSLIVVGTVVVGSYHLHTIYTNDDHARLETAFVRLFLAAILGFIIYWAYLIVRRGEPKLDDLSGSTQQIVRYLASAGIAIVLLLIAYIEPSPALKRLIDRISHVEGGGIKLQLQAALPPGVRGENVRDPYRAGGPPASGTLPGPHQDLELGGAFVRSLLTYTGESEPDKRRDLAIFASMGWAERLGNDVNQNANDRLLERLIPAVDCVEELSRQNLLTPEFQIRIATLVFELRAVLAQELHSKQLGQRDVDYVRELPPAVRSALKSSATEFFRSVRLVSERVGDSAVVRAGYKNGNVATFNQKCGKVPLDNEVSALLEAALERMDFRRDFLFVLIAYGALLSGDRLRSLEDLDGWIREVFYPAVYGRKLAPVPEMGSHENIRDYCATALSKAVRDRSSKGSSASDREVENSVLLCLTFLRLRGFQYQILNLWQTRTEAKTQTILTIADEFAGAVSGLGSLVWQRRTTMHQDCERRHFTRCPAGVTRLWIAEKVWENNWVYTLSKAYRIHRRQAERADLLCGMLLSSQTRSELGVGNYYSFVDTCATWLIRRLAIEQDLRGRRAPDADELRGIEKKVKFALDEIDKVREELRARPKATATLTSPEGPAPGILELLKTSFSEAELDYDLQRSADQLHRLLVEVQKDK